MKHILFSIVLLFMFQQQTFAQGGSVKGTILDQYGKPVIGADILAPDHLIMNVTDSEGKYQLDYIPAGIIKLEINHISITPKTIQNVKIEDNKITLQDIKVQMVTSEITKYIVKAKKNRKSDEAIINLQKKQITVQDGIGAEAIGKLGASSAASVAKFISGTSVVDGKYVYVRGLGDRYTQAQLNGALLVSTDPYINSAPLDLIPSNVLESMFTIKSSSPDLPGNFAGGLINIKTVDYPTALTVNLSTGFTFNPQSSFNDNFLTQESGKYDWLGYDDGKRALPTILNNKENQDKLSSPVFYIHARNNTADAKLLDEASKSLNTQMAPISSTSFMSHSTSLSFGNKYKVFKRTLGLILGVNYKKNLSNYENGTNQAWDITGKDAGELFSYYNLKDYKSEINPVLNGIAGLSYRLNKYNEIRIIQIYNHDTKIMSRYQKGLMPGIISGSDNVFETRTLQFRERGLSTTQLKGKHVFKKLNSAKIVWTGAYSNSYQNEPDLRFFANETVGDSLYYISVAEYDLPNHFFRTLNDKNLEFKADFFMPFKNKFSRKNLFKFGVRTNNKQRVFKENRFYINSKNSIKYQGDQNQFFGESNTGVIGYDSSINKSIIGNYVLDNSKKSNNYGGYEKINAAYAMLIYNFNKKFKSIVGARIEQTQMNVESEDTFQKVGNIKQTNLLPSVNLIYQYSKKTNLRASFSQSIARPSMRELAPFVSFDFIGGFLYVGNPDLQTTQINNYDIRWEKFTKKGEMIAISGYLKNFNNPIIKAYNTDALNPEIIFKNTANARVYGIELDLKKRLDFISHRLANFKTSINFSYIFSRVAMDTAEYNTVVKINPEIEKYRPFQGQSPYLINVMLSYYSKKATLGSDLSLNMVGERLQTIGLNGLPDIYQKSRTLLNFSLYKKLNKRIKISLRANNILNAKYETYQNFKGQNYINTSYQTGTSYSFGFSYTI